MVSPQFCLADVHPGDCVAVLGLAFPSLHALFHDHLRAGHRVAMHWRHDVLDTVRDARRGNGHARSFLRLLHHRAKNGTLVDSPGAKGTALTHLLIAYPRGRRVGTDRQE